MNNKLNILLANLVVEYHKLQNFHWYVKGRDFFTAHAKLEEYYDYINEEIDELAELLLMVGGEPKASLKEFLEIASIEEASSSFIDPKDVFVEVLSDFTSLLEAAKDLKKTADSEDNDVVSAHMDDLQKEFTKYIWMIKQSMK